MKRFINVIQKNRLMHFLRLITVADTWKQIEKSDVLILGHENDHSFKVDGKSYSPLCGSLVFFLEKKGIRCASLMKPYISPGCAQRYYKSSSVNRIFLLAYLLGKLTSFVTRKNYVQLKRSMNARVWARVLQLVEPKIVIAIQPDEALCFACHRLSIPVYDIQHGVIDDISYAYGKEFNAGREQLFLPTGYLCWDEQAAAVLNRWCSDRQRQVVILGHPWVFRFYKKDVDDFIVHSVTNKPPFNQDKKCILISLQWGLDLCYCKFFDKNEFLHPAIMNAIVALGGAVNWLIRLHPIQMKDKNILQRVKWIFESHTNVYIDWSCYSPLPVVLSFAHGHVTWDSSVVIEASLFGIKTYLLNPGFFSVQQASSIYQKSKAAAFELPYVKQEADGLIMRANSYQCAESLIQWINEINSQNQISGMPITFNENKLLELVTGQEQLN